MNPIYDQQFVWAKKAIITFRVHRAPGQTFKKAVLVQLNTPDHALPAEQASCDPASNIIIYIYIYIYIFKDREKGIMWLASVIKLWREWREKTFCFCFYLSKLTPFFFFFRYNYSEFGRWWCCFFCFLFLKIILVKCHFKNLW